LNRTFYAGVVDGMKGKTREALPAHQIQAGRASIECHFVAALAQSGGHRHERIEVGSNGPNGEEKSGHS
jgi:hypothetical protein